MNDARTLTMKDGVFPLIRGQSSETMRRTSGDAGGGVQIGRSGLASSSLASLPCSLELLKR